MKKFIPFLLLLLCQSTQAYECVPGIYGKTVDYTRWTRTNEGWHAAWLCKTPRGVMGYEMWCVHGSCVEGAFIGALANVARSSDPKAQVEAERAKAGMTRCEDATGPSKVVCDRATAERDKLIAAWRATLPPAEKWTIAPNTASTTTPPSRPARRAVNGALVTMSNAPSLAVGVACDSSVKPTFASGSNVWMAVAGQPNDLRWLCVKG